MRQGFPKKPSEEFSEENFARIFTRTSRGPSPKISRWIFGRISKQLAHEFQNDFLRIFGSNENTGRLRILCKSCQRNFKNKPGNNSQKKIRKNSWKKKSRGIPGRTFKTISKWTFVDFSEGRTFPIEFLEKLLVQFPDKLPVQSQTEILEGFCNCWKNLWKNSIENSWKSL